VHDDLARELAFYKQAQTAAEEAIERFTAAGTTWQRPADYYAESVKSDGHMAKVKQQLMYEQNLIEEAEQRCVCCLHGCKCFFQLLAA
jgi:rRNA-processing protein EBP2